MGNQLLVATGQTLYMVFGSTLFAMLAGLPMGVLLVITEKGGIWERSGLNKTLGTIINLLRSIPFIILMIMVGPLSRILVGTTIGTMATIVPLSIAAAPFVARVMEGSLREIDKGVIEFSQAMGATVPQIIWKVMLPEALPSIILGATLTIITLISYSAMAGALGGGGLGDMAIRFGHYRYQWDALYASVLVIIVMIQGIQWAGNYLAARINKK